MKRVVAAFALGLIWASPVNAQSFFNGNAYEFVVDPDISWDDANSDAQGRTFAGVSGHLVTIFNTAENDFVVGLLPGVDNSVWIGATDSDTEGVWRWVTGERFWQGDQNGMPGPDVLFENWGDGEPNDGGGIEDYALFLGQDAVDPIGTFGPGEWNDLQSVGDFTGMFSVAGYIVEYELQLDASTVVLDDQELEADFDTVIPIILQSSEPIVSIDFDITVEYTDFGSGVGAFGSQFLLEVFRTDGVFEVIDIGTIGPGGVATCPEIVECDFDLMFGSTPGTFTASGTITSFADGRPLSDVIIDGPEQWNVGLGTFSSDFNPGGPEGVINGSVTINQLGGESDTTIVVPNAFEFVEGDANNCVPIIGCNDIDRYQQVYGGGEFDAISGQGSAFISEIRFRPDLEFPFAPNGSFADVEIRLSTTPAFFGPDGVTAIGPDNLFTTFADNVGGDEVVVYRGALTLTSAPTGPGPLDFDVIITLQTPFLYDPMAGNLLFEWRNYSGEDISGAADATFIVGDSVSRVFSPLSSDPEAPNGFADTAGLVTRFTFIPPEDIDVVDVPTPVGDDVPVVQVAEFFEMVAAEVVVPGTTSAFFCVGPDRRWVTDRFGHTTFKYRWLRLSELAGSGSCTGPVVEGEPETWEELLAKVDLKVAPFYRSYRSAFTEPGDDIPREDYWVEVALVIVDGAQFNGPNSVINFPEALLDFSVAPEDEQPGCDRDAEWKQLDLAGPVAEFGDFPSADGLKMGVKTGQCNRSRGMTRRTTHAFPFRLAKDYSFEQEAIEIKHIDTQFAGIRKTIRAAQSCADPSLIANMRSSLRSAINALYGGQLDAAEEFLEEIARSAMNSDDFGIGFTDCPVEANYHGDFLQRGITGAFTVHDRWQHPDDFVLYLLPADISVFGFASELPPIP